MSGDVSAQEWLEENGPQGEDEAQAAARALLERREDGAAIAELDALSVFERELVLNAYAAGRADVEGAVRGVVGSAAETVNAAALRGALEYRRDGLDVRSLEELRPLRGILSRERLRAAHLVAGARRTAERIQESRP